MPEIIELREWAGFLFSAVIVPLLVIFSRAKAAINTKLDTIQTKVHEANGRLVRVETWAHEHEKEDAKNYERATAFEDEVRQDFKAMRNSQVGS